MNEQNDGSDQAAITFGFHVVAFLDFLGQATVLSRWDFLPGEPRETAEFISAVRSSFGRIMSWRKEFEKCFSMWQSEYKPPEWTKHNTPDGGEELRRFQEMTMSFMHISDSIIVYSPLENLHGHMKVAGTCGFIITCGTLFLAALNQKTVMRGAIEIGMAGRFPQQDLYGPALSKVHYLENRVARYPRIVIGSSLLEYLRAHSLNTDNNGPARANRVTAALSLRLLMQDYDDHWIVDYLGDEFRKLANNPEGFDKLRVGAAEFVFDEVNRFAREGNLKLTERYKQMAQYYRSKGFE